MSKPSHTPTTRGYKVFKPDFTCKGFQFKIGERYKHDGELKMCSSGFHFCLKASHCFSYYDFNAANIVCEVEAYGAIQTHEEDSKCVTDDILILRQLTWDQVLQVANDGKFNTGHSNTGDRNTGGWNTGDRNTGGWNTGDRNTGGWNTGDRNTGGWNTGDRNTGYSNTGDRNTGGFCTGNAPFPMFNKPSNWAEKDFLDSKAYSLLCQVDTKLWIPTSKMTEDEKKEYPSHTTTDGYLKDIPFKESFQNAWHNWNATNRKAFTSLPNFDKEIFFEITGVKI